MDYYTCTRTCPQDWIFDGNGTASLNTADNNFQIEFTFKSDGFNTSPPSSVMTSACNSNIQISDIDVEGGLLGTILDAIEVLLRPGIEDAVNPLVCEEVDGLSVLMEDLVMSLDGMLEPFEVDIPAKLQDPLYPENNIVVPNGVKLFNFRAADDGGLFRIIFDAIKEILPSMSFCDLRF